MPKSPKSSFLAASGIRGRIGGLWKSAGKGNWDAAQEKAAKVVEDLRAMRLRKAADLVERCIDETLGFYSYPQTHWLRIRTNNPLERIMREIRRRTRVVGAFPDGESAVMLVGARLRHIASTNWGTRKYMSMDWLRQQDMETQQSA